MDQSYNCTQIEIKQLKREFFGVGNQQFVAFVNINMVACSCIACNFEGEMLAEGY
jgi:hypothetical protein